MTQLTKRVQRKTQATVFDRGSRAVYFTLEPAAGDRVESVGVRLAGTREVYRIEGPSLYSFLVQRHATKIEARAKAIRRATGVRISTARATARKELKGELAK